ncbi:MAG TPA: hypothetical protein VLZ31_06890 [Microbacteriaceae bacterium]|nr:hypothetical protein [Microbacteriaceae bacterium]
MSKKTDPKKAESQKTGSKKAVSKKAVSKKAMPAPLKLILFGLSLIAVFGVGLYLGDVLISQDFVNSWLQNGSSD